MALWSGLHYMGGRLKVLSAVTQMCVICTEVIYSQYSQVKDDDRACPTAFVLHNGRRSDTDMHGCTNGRARVLTRTYFFAIMELPRVCNTDFHVCTLAEAFSRTRHIFTLNHRHTHTHTHTHMPKAKITSFHTFGQHAALETEANASGC